MPVQWRFHPLLFHFQLSMSVGWDVHTLQQWQSSPKIAEKGINHKHILKQFLLLFRYFSF